MRGPRLQPLLPPPYIYINFPTECHMTSKNIFVCQKTTDQKHIYYQIVKKRIKYIYNHSIVYKSLYEY